MANKEKQPERPADNVKRVKFNQSLKVPLTPDEIADRADRAAHLVASITAKEDELKAVVKHHKSIIESEAVQLETHSKEVRDRTTYRQVDCERQYDFNSGKYFEVRLDTGEIIAERRLLESEKQMELPFTDPPSDDEKAAAGNVGETAQPIPSAPQDESWRLVPITEALGMGIGKKVNDAFEKCSIATMGDFADFQAKHGEFWIKDLPGVGEAAAEKIIQAAEKFWAGRTH